MNVEKLYWFRYWASYWLNLARYYFLLRGFRPKAKKYSKKSLINKLKCGHLTLLVTTYNQDLFDLLEVKDNFVYIEPETWDNCISNLNKQKIYCIFCKEEDDLFYYQYLYCKGYKIIKLDNLDN